MTVHVVIMCVITHTHIKMSQEISAKTYHAEISVGNMFKTATHWYLYYKNKLSTECSCYTNSFTKIFHDSCFHYNIYIHRENTKSFLAYASYIADTVTSLVPTESRFDNSVK